ncbi:hypothetical protein [Rufibacter immobilis]|uniref:hypothetical protein n=1 Tax=Rufibacter immobilis TaxID=1348778 RepID=UPI0035ECED78
MKKALLITGLGIFYAASGWCQYAPSDYLPVLDDRRPITRYVLGTIPSQEPLLLLGNQETDYASLLVDTKEIKVLQVYKDSTMLAGMGPKAKNGVAVIELTHKRPLLKLNDVLDRFKVPAQQRKLRVLVNKNLVNEKRFLADVNYIAKVEVIKLDSTHPIRLGWDENEQFLNIVTVKK